LLLQICSFDGFPRGVRDELAARGLHGFEEEAYRDPITLEPLVYADFRAALENPVWGRNAFQVGHLNPLKAGSGPGTASGHTADNIGWITEDGNRIQGHLSLEAVRSLLRRIAENYRRRGIWRSGGLDDLARDLARELARLDAIVDHTPDLPRDRFTPTRISGNRDQDIADSVPQAVDDVLGERE
jgi:hypothetical protein